MQFGHAVFIPRSRKSVHKAVSIAAAELSSCGIELASIRNHRVSPGQSRGNGPQPRSHIIVEEQQAALNQENGETRTGLASGALCNL